MSVASRIEKARAYLSSERAVSQETEETRALMAAELDLLSALALTQRQERGLLGTARDRGAGFWDAFGSKDQQRAVSGAVQTLDYLLREASR